MKIKPSKVRGFGSRVRKLRRDRDMTQEALAFAAGIRQGHLSMIEAGNRNPSLPVAEKLARVLGSTVDTLLGAKR